MSLDTRKFWLGHLALGSGATLLDAELCYCTFGKLNADRSNVVLLPTYYTGSHLDYAHLIGVGRALDPARWFIVVPNMFGNGWSSSPSRKHSSQAGPDFPHVDVLDNVLAQERLLREQFGIESIALVAGWSMGALQTYQWASSFPGRVKAILPWCGAARASAHNRIFLAGVKAALVADGGFCEGRYVSPPTQGLKAFGRVYAGWAYSQAFFREGLQQELGCDSVEALLRDWEEDHLCWDANDLLAMLATWECADISQNNSFDGDFVRCLESISARAIVMPCRTDLYFPPEDSALEVNAMPNAQLRVLESSWGHIAGNPKRDFASKQVLEAALHELLEPG
jgi:homoserine O-acetyltransferase